MNTMTKESLKASIKSVLNDRPFVVLAVTVILLGIVYTLLFGLAIHPRDIQVYTHYAAFGEAHFYKTPWQYTILFALFGSMVAVVHVALMLKLHTLEKKQSALLVGWFAIIVLFIGAVYTLSILGLAFR